MKKIMLLAIITVGILAVSSIHAQQYSWQHVSENGSCTVYGSFMDISRELPQGNCQSGLYCQITNSTGQGGGTGICKKSMEMKDFWATKKITT